MLLWCYRFYLLNDAFKVCNIKIAACNQNIMVDLSRIWTVRFVGGLKQNLDC